MNLKSNKILKFISAFIVFTMFFQYGISTQLMAITVEEQVFDKDNSDPFKNETQISSHKKEYKDFDSLKNKKAIEMYNKIPYKDPRLACLLSFIVPGTGEFYLRKDIKGIAFCLSTAALYALSFYYLYLNFKTSDGKSNLIIGSIGAVAAIVMHVITIVESYNDAVEINEARYYFSN